MNKKDHWDNVFSTKQVDEVSWYQQVPQDSLRFVQMLSLPKTAAVIDIGGGDSFLVDYLLEMGFSNITVLDISAGAINKAKNRLGEKADRVNWIVTDILDFKSHKQFDCWHDRAAFHFMTTPEDVQIYLSKAQQHIKPNGKLIIGTFSADGPDKCSNLPVKQYNESLLTVTLQQWFKKIRCISTEHITPFKTIQNFLFCSFQKISI